jgi:predicted lactoylglutathione lyase
MNFRYARHTNNLKPLVDFYTRIIGLEKLGDFENHSNYNGVFLGLPNLAWHLEFTESSDKVNRKPDEDDLIVFYLESLEELNRISKVAEEFGIAAVKSKNPYWQMNGIELKDPDGFGVMLTVKQK